jgi:hypothetical protein
MLAFAITAGFSMPANAGAEDAVITRLQYGPVCGEDPDLHLCGQSSDIVLTGKSTCVYAMQQGACTWYGFAFDYALSTDGGELDCTWSSDTVTDVGNPTALLDKSVTSGTYKIALTGRSGHFFNPQYATYDPSFKGVRTFTQSCTYQGKKQFEFILKLHSADEGPA